jgi:hypothetical protein
VFAQPFTNAVAVSEKAEFLDAIRARLARTLRRPDGSWYVDYVRLRFKASS